MLILQINTDLDYLKKKNNENLKRFKKNFAS
jgi:hypothetical protein